MNTPTHMLINWTAAESLAGRPGAKGGFPKSAVLLGAVAPDLPLYLLSIGGAAWFRRVQGWEWRETAEHMYSYLFYHDPWWISLHNSLHSPLVLVAFLLVLVARKGRAGVLQSWWGWFFLSCLLHTLVDIPVHYDDGPLLLWPLNWSYRFASPLSYWDTAHYAAIVMPFEAALSLVLLGRIIFRRRTAAAPPDNVS